MDDLLIQAIIDKRYEDLQQLVDNDRKEFFTDDNLWQVMNQHDLTAIKIMLPMYDRNPQYLIDAVEVSSPEIVQLLLDEGFPVNERIIANMYFAMMNKKNLLMVLHHWNPKMTLTDFLIRYHLSYARNEIDKYPITLMNNWTLLYAFYANNIDLAKVVLDRGTLDFNDSQIIFKAIDAGVAFVKLILNSEFKVKFTDQLLHSKLLLKIFNSTIEIFLLFLGKIDVQSKIVYNNQLITPIEYIVQFKTIEWLKAIVDIGGIDPNKIDIDDTFDPVILLTAALAKFDMVDYLLPNTRYIDRIDAAGYNLITYVIWHKNENIELLQKLIDYKADLNTVINMPSEDGMRRLTPLLLAAKRGKIRSVEILVKAGCDINFTLDQENVFTSSNESHAEKLLQLGFSAIWVNDIKYTAGIWTARFHGNRNTQLACLKYLPQQVNIGDDVTFFSAATDTVVAKELLRAGADPTLIENAFDLNYDQNYPEDKLLLLLECGLRPMRDLEEYNFTYTVGEALIFWNLSVEERLKYSIKEVARLCPMYREKLALMELQIRSPALSMLPDELLQRISQFMEE